MTLPTFVVIGAMKAGTVSLCHYLDDHPGVFLGARRPRPMTEGMSLSYC